MKATDLLRFVNDNSVEYHYHDGDVLMMPTLDQTMEFNKLLSSCHFDEGIECIMRDGYFVFHMESICGYYGIELFDIFPNETN
jgi:hypothetical protein